MLPQEALEEQLGNILNRLNAVVSEGKGLLNERNIPYDNLPAFDSIIKAIKDYPNYKSFHQKLQYTWFEPLFMTGNAEYYVNRDPVVSLVEFGTDYILVTKSGKIFHSEDCNTCRYIYELSVSELNLNSNTIIALPQWTIRNCPYAILIAGINDQIIISFFDFKGEHTYRLMNAGSNIYGISFSNVYHSANKDGLVINLLCEFGFKQYEIDYDDELLDNEISITEVLHKSYDELIPNDAWMTTKYSLEVSLDRYDFKQQHLYTVKNGHSVLASHEGGTDIIPCQFKDIECSGMCAFVQNKIIFHTGNNTITVYTEDNDGNYTINHSIDLYFDDDEIIENISCCSSGILIIVSSKAVYITDEFDTAKSYIQLMDAIKLPSTIREIQKIITTRCCICIIDSNAKCYILRLPDSMANENTLSIGTETLCALNGRYIRGNIGSNLRGYYWKNIRENGDNNISINMDQFNPFGDTGLAYGNGIAIMYKPKDINTEGSKNLAYSYNGDYWIAPVSLQSNFDAHWITFMKDKFYAISALGSDNEFVVFSTSHDPLTWDTNIVKYDNIGEDINGNMSMRSRLEQLTGVLGSEQGIFLLGSDITKCAVLSPNLILDYVNIEESTQDVSQPHVLEPYGWYIKERFFIGGNIIQESSLMKSIMLVGTMSWKPSVSSNHIFNWKRLLKIIVSYDDELVPQAGFIRLYTNGDSLLAVSYSKSSTSINDYVIEAIYDCEISFGELERKGYGEVININITSKNTLDMNWIKGNKQVDFNLISICGTAYILWGETVMISHNGRSWRKIGENIYGIPDFNSGVITSGMVGDMAITRAINSDGNWTMFKSGDIKPRNSHVLIRTGLLQTDGVYEYHLDFTPKFAALFTFGNVTSAHVISTERLFTKSNKDIYSIIINDSTIITNSDDINMIADIGYNSIMFTGDFITSGNQYIVLAF